MVDGLDISWVRVCVCHGAPDSAMGLQTLQMFPGSLIMNHYSSLQYIYIYIYDIVDIDTDI